MGSGQAGGPWPAGPVDARIPGSPRSKHRRSGGWRPGPGYPVQVHHQRHAASDGSDLPARVRHPAEHHLRDFEAFMPRRIYTDGRSFPTDEEPSFMGYSIGQWLDTDGDGRFDTLEIETRNFKGPRTVEFTGIALHDDNQTIVKERIHLDSRDPEIMHNEITIIDHAFTRPWTVDKRYRRIRNVIWYEDNCNENNHHIVIGKDNYFVSGDGYLMPARKGQSPPDLRYFKQTAK